MKAKLTLVIESDIIELAKKYAAMQQRSLSSIIESYLSTLTTSEKHPNSRIQISSFVKDISSGTNIPDDLDHKSL